MSVGTLFCLWLNLISGEPWQNTEGSRVSEVRVLILLTPSLWGHLGKVPRWNTTTLFKAVFSIWLSFSRFWQPLLLVSLYLGLVTVVQLPTPDYCPQFLVVLFQPEYTFVKSSLVNKPLNYLIGVFHLMGNLTNTSTVHLNVGLMLAKYVDFCFDIVDATILM